MSSDLIGGYLTLNLKQPIKWADNRLDALLADRMLTKLYTTGPKDVNFFFLYVVGIFENSVIKNNVS
jgi:hypothetical protein